MTDAPAPVPEPQADTAGPSTTKKWLIPFAVVGAVVLAIIIGSVAGSGDDEPAAPSQSQLEVARSSCSAGEVADGGHTLVVDTAGKDAGSGSASFEDLACVLASLGAPTSVTTQIEQTRAMDGMQDATWSGFSAKWTYHPDAGLDIILTDN